MRDMEMEERARNIGSEAITAWRPFEMIESGFKTGSRAGPAHEQPQFTRGPKSIVTGDGPRAEPGRPRSWSPAYPV
jgi:hypothetical protein